MVYLTREAREEYFFLWTLSSVCDNCCSLLGAVRRVSLKISQEWQREKMEGTWVPMRPQSLWISQSWKCPSLGPLIRRCACSYCVFACFRCSPSSLSGNSLSATLYYRAFGKALRNSTPCRNTQIVFYTFALGVVSQGTNPAWFTTANKITAWAGMVTSLHLRCCKLVSIKIPFSHHL